MHNADLVLASLHGVLESEPQDTLGSLLCDELDALYNTINYNVLDTRVFTLGVFADKDSVDVVVRSFVANDRSAGTEVCEEVEGSAEGKVERDVTFADGCLGFGSINTLIPQIALSIAYR